jgi:hypothetical protein
MPGGVQRMTVAVLVNERCRPARRRRRPRTEEELAALRDLVASAVGLNEARGDVITSARCRSRCPDAVGGGRHRLLEQLLAGLDLMRLLQLAVLAAVALVLGLFVVRPILLRPPAPLAEFPRLADAARPDGPDLPGRSVPDARSPDRFAPDATQRLVRAMELRASPTRQRAESWIRCAGGQRVTVAALLLDSFDEVAAAARPGPVPEPSADATRRARPSGWPPTRSGYRSGWDDCLAAEQDTRARVGAELASNLADLGFTYHEARAQLLAETEALLEAYLPQGLPRLAGPPSRGDRGRGRRAGGQGPRPAGRDRRLAGRRGDGRDRFCRYRRPSR